MSFHDHRDYDVLAPLAFIGALVIVMLIVTGVIGIGKKGKKGKKGKGGGGIALVVVATPGEAVFLKVDGEAAAAVVSGFAARVPVIRGQLAR